MHCNDEVKLQRPEVVPGHWGYPKNSRWRCRFNDCQWTDAESMSSVWLTRSLSQNQTDAKSRSKFKTDAKSRSCRAGGVYMLRGDWSWWWSPIMVDLEKIELTLHNNQAYLFSTTVSPPQPSSAGLSNELDLASLKFGLDFASSTGCLDLASTPTRLDLASPRSSSSRNYQSTSWHPMNELFFFLGEPFFPLPQCCYSPLDSTICVYSFQGPIHAPCMAPHCVGQFQ